MSQALIKQEIDGALVDNFVITKVKEQIKNEPVRIEKFIEHPVVYGLALGFNSSKMARCMRHFKTSYARKVSEAITVNLQPVKVRLFFVVTFTKLQRVKGIVGNRCK